MITLNIDLSRMTADQIAILEALSVRIKQIPSRQINAISDAGEANCGHDEYERIYKIASGMIDEVERHA